MSNDTHNIILDHLRALRSSMSRIENDIQDMKFRLGQLEETSTHHTKRFDRIDERLATLEARFETIEA